MLDDNLRPTASCAAGWASGVLKGMNPPTSKHTTAAKGLIDHHCTCSTHYQTPNPIHSAPSGPRNAGMYLLQDHS